MEKVEREIIRNCSRSGTADLLVMRATATRLGSSFKYLKHAIMLHSLGHAAQMLLSKYTAISYDHEPIPIVVSKSTEVAIPRCSEVRPGLSS